MPEMYDVPKFAEADALEVAAVPSVDPVIRQVRVVAENACNALRCLLATLKTACYCRTAAADAGRTNVDVVLACKDCGDDFRLAVDPLFHVVGWCVLMIHR